MRDRLIASAVLTTIVGLTAPVALGQVGRAAAGSTDAGRTGAGVPAADVQPDTRSLMQADGGSLLQASVPPPDGQPGAPAATGGAGASRAPSYSLYAVPDADPHVLKKHDLVNIVVREDSKSQASGASNQQRQSDLDTQVKNFVHFNFGTLSLHGVQSSTSPEINISGDRSFQGTGEYDREDSMTTRLEAEVIDVKPNGTMVIQARRHMKIDEEEISLCLTGICRVEDVDATNSVLSTSMHDLSLQKTTTGQVHDTTERGLAHRLLDLINPF
jgi:flagellar L-ring protein precursor FlgH